MERGKEIRLPFCGRRMKRDGAEKRFTGSLRAPRARGMPTSARFSRTRGAEFWTNIRSI